MTEEATGSAQTFESMLTSRLATIELENARFRRLAYTAIGITAVSVGLAAAVIYLASRRGLPGTVAEVTESRRFIVRAEDGTVRGSWGLDDDGALRLTLTGPSGSGAITLALLTDGSSGATFADSAGRSRMVIGLLPDETASFVLADRRGLARSVYSLQGSGAATLVFADKGGDTRTAVGVDDQGRPMLSAGAEVVQEEAPQPSEIPPPTNQ